MYRKADKNQWGICGGRQYAAITERPEWQGRFREMERLKSGTMVEDGFADEPLRCM